MQPSVPGEILFISDSHLQAGRPETMQAFADFVQSRAAQAARLYILGDLFEVWLGDDDDSEAYRPVIEPLTRLAETCEVFFMAGNRDFLVGENFADRVGLTLLNEPCPLELGQSRVVLLHGDVLCTDDHDYQAFRALVRDPLWQADFLARPLAERRRIAAQLRRDSAAAMSQKSSEIMDVNAAAVRECFRRNDADVIIHGHTHRPALHRYEPGLLRIVLGDWLDRPSYLSWTEKQGFQLTDPRV
jgi:UDP-2,3-diacylglucosamine hydrolase